MAYVVIEAFTDSNLNSVDENGEKHVYWEGDTYPYKSYAGATTKLRLKELLEGGSAEDISERLGKFMVMSIQRTIAAGGFTPNAPATVKKKGHSKPLIDTGGRSIGGKANVFRFQSCFRYVCGRLDSLPQK